MILYYLPWSPVIEQFLLLLSEAVRTFCCHTHEEYQLVTGMFCPYSSPKLGKRKQEPERLISADMRLYDACYSFHQRRIKTLRLLTPEMVSEASEACRAEMRISHVYVSRKKEYQRGINVEEDIFQDGSSRRFT